MIDFLIIYELPQRELENVTLLGAELERRGYTVCYQKYPYHNLKQLRKKYVNNVRTILTQSMYDEKVLVHLVYELVGKVNKIVNLQWEQVGTVENEESAENYRMPKQSAKTIPHICWGEKPKEVLVKSGMTNDKTIVTGPIHMDFLRPEFKDYYMNKETLLNMYSIPEDKKVALFISSLSYASLNKKQEKELIKKLGKEFVEYFVKISKETQENILCWIKKLLNEDKDLIFIYRPHPAEKGNILLKELSLNCERFLVISDHSVKQWIKVCDVIYNWFSTSAAEVFYSGKKAYVLRPVEIPKQKDVALMRDCHFITSYDEFKQSLYEDSEMTLSDKIVKAYYDVADEPSYKRVADFLEKVINTNEFDYKWSKDTQKFCKACYRKRMLHISLANIKVAVLYVINSIKKLSGMSFDEYYTSFYKKREESVCKIKAEEHRVREKMCEIVKKIAPEKKI